MATDGGFYCCGWAVLLMTVAVAYTLLAFGHNILQLCGDVTAYKHATAGVRVCLYWLVGRTLVVLFVKTLLVLFAFVSPCSVVFLCAAQETNEIINLACMQHK